MNTDPIAERSRLIDRLNALQSQGSIDAFNPDMRTAARLLFDAQEATFKLLPDILAALITESRPEGLEREFREAEHALLNMDHAPRHLSDTRKLDRKKVLAFVANLGRALATPQPQANLQENLAGSQTDAPASGEVERYDCGNLGWCHAEGRCTRHDPTPTEGAPDSALEEAAKSKLRSIIAHATGGSCDDPELPLNDICCRITEHRNMVYRAGKLARLRTAKPEQADHVVGFADTDVEQPEQAGDWFTRNADVRNPEAHIRTNPEYFGQECAAAIMEGRLVAPQGQNSEETNNEA